MCLVISWKNRFLAIWIDYFKLLAITRSSLRSYVTWYMNHNSILIRWMELWLITLKHVDGNFDTLERLSAIWHKAIFFQLWLIITNVKANLLKINNHQIKSNLSNKPFHYERHNTFFVISSKVCRKFTIQRETTQHIIFVISTTLVLKEDRLCPLKAVAFFFSKEG